MKSEVILPKKHDAAGQAHYLSLNFLIDLKNTKTKKAAHM